MTTNNLTNHSHRTFVFSISQLNHLPHCTLRQGSLTINLNSIFEGRTTQVFTSRTLPSLTSFLSKLAQLFRNHSAHNTHLSYSIQYDKTIGVITIIYQFRSKYHSTVSKTCNQQQVTDPLMGPKPIQLAYRNMVPDPNPNSYPTGT